MRLASGEKGGEGVLWGENGGVGSWRKEGGRKYLSVLRVPHPAAQIVGLGFALREGAVEVRFRCKPGWGGEGRGRGTGN